MSEALERVIAEQQERIDRLEKNLKIADQCAMDNHKKAEVFAIAVVNYQARALRWLPVHAEKKEDWMKTNSWLREEMKTFGFCVNCSCLDYCQCDPDCGC